MGSQLVEKEIATICHSVVLRAPDADAGHAASVMLVGCVTSVAAIRRTPVGA
jgi:hypothetical protein